MYNIPPCSKRSQNNWIMSKNDMWAFKSPQFWGYFYDFLRRTQWNNIFNYLYYPILRISFWLWISFVPHFEHIITFISIDNISKDKGEKKIYQCTNLSCQLKGCQVINYHLFCAFNIRVKKKMLLHKVLLTAVSATVVDYINCFL